jgi:hypothetical protein
MGLLVPPGMGKSFRSGLKIFFSAIEACGSADGMPFAGCAAGNGSDLLS